MSSERYLTAAEVAEILNVHRTTVERMCKRGQLPGTLDLGSEKKHSFRIPRAALEALTFKPENQEQLKAPEPPPLRTNNFPLLSRFTKAVR